MCWNPKKYLKGERQLYFEFVNYVILPYTEKTTVACSAILFLMEALQKYDTINIPRIMLEHMGKVITILRMGVMDCPMSTS